MVAWMVVLMVDLTDKQKVAKKVVEMVETKERKELTMVEKKVDLGNLKVGYLEEQLVEKKDEWTAEKKDKKEVDETVAKTAVVKGDVMVFATVERKVGEMAHEKVDWTVGLMGAL